MADILGFVFVVAGFITAQHYGYIGTGRALLHTAYRGCVNFMQRMEFHYKLFAARRIFWALLIAAGLQIALLTGTALLLHDWNGTFVAMSLVLIAAEVLYAFYQRPGIPHILTDGQGHEVHWPDYMQNEQGQPVDGQGHVLHVNDNGFPLRFFKYEAAGNWLDPDGNAIPANAAGLPRRYGLNGVGQWIDRADGTVLAVDGHGLPVANGQPVNLDIALDTTAVLEQTDVRIPHPLAGLPQLDDTHPNRLDRLSTLWSSALIFVAFLVIGAGIMVVGVQSGHSLAFLLGAVCIYAMLMVFQLLANVIAWAVRKSTKLLEFISTLVIQGGLVTLPGITWSNIRQQLPGGVDYLDEERIAAILRAFPLQIAMHITPFVAVVWMWTDPVVASFTLTFLFATTISGYYLAKNGGAQEVENRRYQFARALFYSLPTLCLLGFALGFLPEDVKTAFIGQLANLKSAIVGYGSGQKTIELSAWWQNLLASIVCGGVTLGLGAIVVFLAPFKKPGNKDGWLSRGLKVVVALGFLCTLWFVFGFVMNILGVEAVGAPAIPALSKTAAVTAPSATVAASPPKSDDAKSDQAPSKPAPTSTAKPPSGGRREKPPSRYADGDTSVRRTGRGQLSPEFLALERSLEAGR